MAGIGRKDPCPCGSGKRYKHCCGMEAAGQDSQLSAAALYARAHRAHAQGHKAEAARLYQSVLSLSPDHPDALHYLGMLAMESGRVDMAYAMVKRSLELKPREADYWANAALIEQAAQRPEAAMAAYRESIRLSPEDAERHLLLGSLLLMHGHVDEAMTSLTQATVRAPGVGQAWFLLGNACMKSRPVAYDAAVGHYRKALKLMPKNVPLRTSLATALAMTQQREEALKILIEATEIEPDNVGIWSNLGRYWLDAGEAEKAVDCYRQVVTRYPDLPSAQVELGMALKTKGDFAQAQTCFARALELEPANIKALASVIESRRFDRLDDPDLCNAMMRADEAAESDENVPGLCFALGKSLDRLGAFEQAFACYARANRIKTGQSPFDRGEFSAWVDRRIAEFDAAAIARLEPVAHATDRLIFIVGMPRSGTTLTEQILSAHSAVVGGGERSFWPVQDVKLVQYFAQQDDAAMRAVVQHYLDDLNTVSGAADALRMTDKMPDNFKRIGILHGLFPNARFVHVHRHPADTCLSIFFQNFNGHDYGSNLEDLAFYYRQYKRLMAHWVSVVPADRILDFNYETLVADQEMMSRKLIEFCGLTWEPACLDFQNNERVVRTASIWQVRQKMYSSSVDRWKNYAPHIAPLLSLLQE